MSLAEAAPRPRGLTLLISDIDGTLVTADKTLTAAAADAARSLRPAGLGFTMISSRPPRGMRRLVEALGVTLPFAAYNGGALVAADGGVIQANPLAPDVASRALDVLLGGGVDAWVFAGDDWLLRDRSAANVGRERRTVQFEPTVVPSFDHIDAPIGKIVGVSDDFGRLDACEAAMRAALGPAAAVNRSQRYYLDVSHPSATKGAGVTALCGLIGASLAATAVIGDMFNDISMFDVAGFAVAMGQAPDAVKARAGHVTASNEEDGFALAVRDIILPRAAGPA